MTTQNPTSESLDRELETSAPSSPADGCPDWAHEVISTILVLEVEAGTIKNPAENAATNGWSTANLEDLTKVASRLDDQEREALANKVEALFGRLARGLATEGHSPDVIAAMINARIPTGCNLPYCNGDEVRGALS
jgi:hypothetical protein